MSLKLICCIFDFNLWTLNNKMSNQEKKTWLKVDSCDLCVAELTVFARDQSLSTKKLSVFSEKVISYIIIISLYIILSVGLSKIYARLFQPAHFTRI